MARSRRTPAVIMGALLLGGGVGLLASRAAAAPTFARLHLGSDGRFFEYGSTTQNLTTQSNSCKINSAEPVMDLSSTGSQSAPGLGADAIGVKGSPSSGNGTPCNQIDRTESLTLMPGTTIGSRTFSGVRLDLEMTGNAVVKLTLASGTTSAVYQLQTGTSITAAQSSEPDYDTVAPYVVASGPGDTTDACAAPNSSGPNSGSNDNCEWNVVPGFNFDQITLTTVNYGSVSLEGGGDFGNDPNHDTIFYLSNAAPTPTNDTVSTYEDTPANGNVLTNDTDPDGNALTAALVTGPAHGTLTLSPSGAFTYTPAADYNGADGFTYAASDGLASTNATVSIAVTAVNDPPVANDDTTEVDEGSSVTIDVVANDTDVDGDTLTPTSLASLSPTGSTAIVNADRTVTFTPPAGYVGAASFTYTATDGQAQSNVATVDLTVFPVICSNETVSGADADVAGSFSRLDDTFACKRYALDADATNGTVLFQPTGSSVVTYRGFVSFAADPPPTPGGPGTFTLLLRYDPNGGASYRPVPWCVAPQFDADGLVTSATIPAGDTWCIASADTRPDGNGDLATKWQVYGRDDPKFTR